MNNFLYEGKSMILILYPSPKMLLSLTEMYSGRRGTSSVCWQSSLRVWWLCLCRSRRSGDDRTPPTSLGCIPALASCRYVASYHSLPLSEKREIEKQTYELKIKHEKKTYIKVNGFIILFEKLFACLLWDEKWLFKKAGLKINITRKF